jgi:hypothetical protein
MKQLMSPEKLLCCKNHNCGFSKLANIRKMDGMREDGESEGKRSCRHTESRSARRICPNLRLIWRDELHQHWQGMSTLGEKKQFLRARSFFQQAHGLADQCKDEWLMAQIASPL